jgi:hypothetical protein
MEYLVNGKRFTLSYIELREKYFMFIKMSDKEFLNNLPSAAHFACIVGWLKELPNDAVIGDQGIVHEIIHLIHIPNSNTRNLKEIRKQFKQLLKLD